MKLFRAWIVMLGWALAYFAYRAGLKRNPPNLMRRRYELMRVIGHVMRWDKRLRYIDAHKCVQQGPAIVTPNHFNGEDPCIMWRAIYDASHGTLLPRFMMREGVFREGSFAKSKMLDLDEVLALGGITHISRDGVQLSQMKPFLKFLAEGESFFLYPTRTRSRSGMLAEYPKGLEEPGAVSFFLAQANRRNPERPVAVVPFVRTHNPVTKRDTMFFADAQYLPGDADRAAQRAFDHALVNLLGDLVEINAPHILCTLIYLRCLHNLPEETSEDALSGALSDILRELEDTRRVDPAALEDPRRETKRTLKWLTRQNVLTRKGDTIHVNRDAVLAAPPLDEAYKKANPVKYLTNQILHLSDVIRAVEKVVLGC